MEVKEKNIAAIKRSVYETFESAMLMKQVVTDDLKLTTESVENYSTLKEISLLGKSNITSILEMVDDAEALEIVKSKMDYMAKIDQAVDYLIKNNTPFAFEDFRNYLMRTVFIKRKIKPWLMGQGLSDYQIDNYIGNIIKVAYQKYQNYFNGGPMPQYIK